VLGFAMPTFLLMAIPFASVVVFPVATAGGTLLARQLLGERTSTQFSPPIRRS
jgi:CysZ protein